MTTATAWLLAVFGVSVVIALVNSVPVEIVYTGEGCDCPTKLDYQLNVPNPPKTKKYTPSEYGYKVDVPVQAKAKVSYSFDFTVEEPKTPAPVKPKKWDLYAKVDRIAVNKGDCRESEAPTCTCGQCGVTKPLYRYVYKKMKPCDCGCGRPDCTCGQKRNFVVEAIQVPANTEVLGSGDGSRGANEQGNNIRRKRDLFESTFRPRKGDGRFVKMYHKNINEKSKSLFGFDMNGKKDKRKTKKTLFARIVKRDIKGEYDLIEDERKKMDLTLPEIIQFMPETLQPNFKRGSQCYFGCQKAKQSGQSQQRPRDSDNSREQSDRNDSAEDTKVQRAEDDSREMQTPRQNQRYFKQAEFPSANAVGTEPASSSSSTTYTKRNAAHFNYHIRPSTSAATAASASSSASFKPLASAYASGLPLLGENTAYATENSEQQQQNYNRMPQKSTNPIQVVVKQSPQKTSYSAITATGGSLSPDYVYEQIGQKYAERDNNGCVRVIAATPTVPDPTAISADEAAASLPMRYAGDIDTPARQFQALVRDQRHRRANDQTVSSRHYPVQHISNDQLDKIIAEIVYRHPDFVEATAHSGGGLVDPEPWQEEETKDFIRRLLDGRLDLWFGGHDPIVNFHQPPMSSYNPNYYYQYTHNPYTNYPQHQQQQILRPHQNQNPPNIYNTQPQHTTYM